MTTARKAKPAKATAKTAAKKAPTARRPKAKPEVKAPADVLDPDPPDAPWLRFPDEPERAYAAFLHYRDAGMGKRSLRRTTKEFYGLDELPPSSGPTSGKHRQITQWSSDWSWRDRVRLWDDHVERIGRIEALEEVRSMNRRHAATAVLAINRAVEKLRATQSDTLTVNDAVRLMEIGVKVERLARGEPTEIQEATVTAATVEADALLDKISSNPELAWAARAVALAYGSGPDDDDD